MRFGQCVPCCWHPAPVGPPYRPSLVGCDPHAGRALMCRVWRWPGRRVARRAPMSCGADLCCSAAPRSHLVLWEPKMREKASFMEKVLKFWNNHKTSRLLNAMLKLLQGTLCFLFQTLSTGVQVPTDIYIFKMYLSSIYKRFLWLNFYL